MNEERCPTCKKPAGAIGYTFDPVNGYCPCPDRWHDVLRVAVRKEAISPVMAEAMRRMMDGTTKEIP